MQVTAKRATTSRRPAKASRRRPRVDSVERMLAQVGDVWTFLVLREAYFGVRRFDQFRRNLASAPNILTDRLKKLVAHGILARSQYQQRPPRFEYRLTDKGLDLYPVIVMMMRWGDRWLDEGEGAPLVLTHRPCGHASRPELTCSACGEAIRARDMEWHAGPGAKP